MDKKVILFLIDGLRPDAIHQTETPFMDQIMNRGCYSHSAQTVMPSITLPCHTSLFFSVPPTRHGVMTNTWVPMARPLPGLFEVLHQQGLITTSFYNWEELRDLSLPGTLDFSLFIRNSRDAVGKGDLELSRFAIEWLATQPFHFAFIYLGQTDEVGHLEGWLSEPYLESVHYADAAIGKVMEALGDDVTYIITADHGGHDRNHGSDIPEDMTIPIMIQSPENVRMDLHSYSLSIMDIAPSILSLFDIPIPRDWDGKSFWVRE